MLFENGLNMTDNTTDERIKKDRYRTKSDDFIRFLEANAPKSSCTVCKHKKWTVLCDPAEDGVSYRVSSPIKNASRPGVVSEFLVYCSNCGHTRRFMSRVVNLWVENNPPIEEVEESISSEEPEELGPEPDSEPSRDET